MNGTTNAEYCFADLHCDLLTYLALNQSHSPFDADALCSLTQLRAGRVIFQALPIFVFSKPGSTSEGERQAQAYQQLLVQHPEYVTQATKATLSDPAGLALRGQTSVMAAIENASGFCSEDESLAQGFARLERFIQGCGGLLYIGPVWGDANRFGGGNYSQEIGLRPDGKELLQFMDGRKIALDLSHSSDLSAREMFEYIDQKQLDIAVIASHSNYRLLTEHPRNLPEDLAQEIAKRGGLIGLNILNDFVGGARGPAKHLAHAASLNEHSMSLGFDFYPEKYFHFLHPERPADWTDFPHGYSNSSSYPKFLQDMQAQLSWSEQHWQKLAWENVINFMRAKSFSECG
jgi:membrane dipeptidase